VGDTFSDLPDALVRDLLAQATPVAEKVSAHLNLLREARGDLRQRVQSKGLIARKADLEVPREPSVVGIDGSYQVHRLTALDLCAAAAVAVVLRALATRFRVSGLYLFFSTRTTVILSTCARLASSLPVHP